MRYLSLAALMPLLFLAPSVADDLGDSLLPSKESKSPAAEQSFDEWFDQLEFDSPLPDSSPAASRLALDYQTADADAGAADAGADGATPSASDAAADDGSGASPPAAVGADDASAPTAPALSSSVEEVYVTAKANNTSEARLNLEVFEADVHIDALSAKEIGLNGDSDAAAALARLPGLSLVEDKYVYVRGLGERFSSSTLNRALVPSPDLTRDVLPLDLFPTSIIESVTVRKSYEVDRPAGFGGGEIDVRTQSTPRDFFLELGLGLGANSDVDGFKSYPTSTAVLDSRPGQQAELSQVIVSALQSLRGHIDPNSISVQTGQDFAAGAAVNRELATHTNRDFRIRSESANPDYSLSLSGGDRYHLQGGDSSLGYIGHFSYDRAQRHRNIENRRLSNPAQNFSLVDESEEQTKMVGYGAIGLEFAWSQKIDVSYLFLRDSSDRTSIEEASHQTFDGDRRRNYWLRYQTRDLTAWQIQGSHGPEDVVRIDWHVSLANVVNDSPNELRLGSDVSVGEDGVARAESLSPDLGNVELGYTTLEGRSNNYALSFKLPLGEEDSHALEFGLDISEERRDLAQTVLLLGSSAVSIPVSSGNLLGAFTPDFIMDPANEVQIDFDPRDAKPYSADALTRGYYGLFRLSLGQAWRLSAGLRWESYGHNSRILDPVSRGPRRSGAATFSQSQLFPSFNALYTKEGGNWAMSMQARLSYGRTAVRPDAREISNAVFIHPLTNARVQGNPLLLPAVIDNLNASLTWHFENSQRLGVSLFYKSISDPIENFESPLSDNDTSSAVAQTIANAASARVFGVELDGRIAFANDRMHFSGNLTLLDSELVAGNDLGFTPTNDKRALTNASDYVLNLALGYADREGRHSTRLVYLLFGERLQYAGQGGDPDTVETPSQWLNLNYIYTLERGFSLQAKLANILGEGIDYTKNGQSVYRSNVGRQYSLGLSWKF